MTVAYWCVLVAALLPYVFAVVAKSQAGYDNRVPREYLQRTTGFRQRAHWAQLNSFEAFPAFAVAVIVAHLASAAQHRIDLLALIFVAARIVYGVFYIADKASLRSLTWSLGLACVIGLFVVASIAN